MKTMHSMAMALLMLVVLSSCSSSKMPFMTSSVTPAATGGVTIKKDKNENYALDVDVVNLAEPKQLTPARETYVVWMEDGANPVKKLGQIDTSSGFLSKTMKASLSATATAKPSRIFITAENEAGVQYPAGEIVLTTANSKP